MVSFTSFQQAALGMKCLPSLVQRDRFIRGIKDGSELALLRKFGISARTGTIIAMTLQDKQICRTTK
jgi:hypothetical protein